MQALGAVTKRKAALIGTPIGGYAVYRRERSRGPPMDSHRRAIHCRLHHTESRAR